jgi:hypothetical protein
MRVLDTLEYARRLEKAGVGREQAEAHAAIMSEMILVEVATKADIDDATVALGKELRAEMGLMRAGLERRIDKLEEKVDRIQDRLTIRMGGMIVVGIGIVTALQKLL